MVWVPGPIKFDTRTLFKRLERVNPGLKTTLWRLYDGELNRPAQGYFLLHRQTRAESEAPGVSGKMMGEEVGKPPAQQGRYWGPGGNPLKRTRACIYVNGVDAMPLPQLSTMDLAAAVLSFQERNMIRRIVICSSYLPYDAPVLPPNRELEDLVNFCKTKSWDLLMEYSKRESLLEYLMTTELQLLNRGSQPTFRNNVRKEVIDITLCTSNIVHKIKEWRVSGETSLSDHCHILFTLSKEARQAIAYRDPKATNWDLYRSELTRDIEATLEHSVMASEECLSLEVLSISLQSCMCPSTFIGFHL
ncbi:hypothetical protein J437_LFUL007072 [Ladona fulva]|uniref:Endonuclease/exonuclease/phosphatase domain-containing protein n=1 Tax=Ladona fulva TaxID=123851 RepID=A0A8K0K5H7_LADFU|nr:hypothetical protein J437_LFUL007072 [Ladona fulva]